jgi:ketosteroid isomerase-like protein
MAVVMRAFGERDLETMFGFLADDVVVEMPFEARHGYGSLDKAGFRALIELLSTMYDRFSIEFDRVFALPDDRGVVAEYHSDAVLAESGVPYRNSYCGVFLFTGGKISHWREYDDPTVVDAAMAAHAAELARR